MEAEQFEKNRLAACDRATKEEIEREQDFCDKIIIGEHRQPTYSDAIEYGINWQKEKMMANGIDGEVVATSDNGWESIRFYKTEHHCGQKVKVIVITED